ncbi:MAG: hypothetical protein EBS86_02555 [Crocinitomicaceae bacterium]|nr:hypothetical protein [Crocinitomicaceae bacterium]
MVDNIKIVLPFTNVSKQYFGKPYSKYGNVEKFKLFFTESCGKDDPFLIVEINSEKNIVKILGSFRKWSSSKSNAITDLTKDKFLFCLEKIERKLKIPFDVLQKGVVTKIEIGANIKMKPKYKYILSCIDHFPKLKKEIFEVDTTYLKNTKELETVYFHAANFSLMFYNKLEEVFSNKKKKNLSKLSKGMFVFRYEIKIKKVSGYILKEKLNTVENILNNWNEIIEHWTGRLNELTFIDNLSAENIHDKEDMNLTEIKERLIYLGMTSFGWENTRLLIENLGVQNKVSENTKKLKSIWEQFRNNDNFNYSNILKSEILKRGEKLKCYENS